MSLPPLVPADGAIEGVARTRYARHLLLPELGLDGQRRLRTARVLLVGAGGLGSPAALYLAAAGVGVIGLVDDDVVELTNLQRQILHGTADVGAAKVDSGAEALAAMNPDVTVRTHHVRLTSETALDVLADYDVVIDGADNFPTRYLVGDACARLGIPHVWGSVYRFDAQMSVWFAGVGPCYRCVFPDSPPEGSVPSCATGGVLGSICGAVGSVLATEAMKLITGMGEPLVGRLLVHDALRQSWGHVPVAADPGCPVCRVDADPLRPLGLPVDTSETKESDGQMTDADGAGAATRWTAKELEERLASRAAGAEDFVLVDVREPAEVAIVTIPGAIPWPLDHVRSGTDAPDLPDGIPVVAYCKAGGRSAQAAQILRSRGIRATDVEGGVLAWVSDVDPSLPTY